MVHITYVLRSGWGQTAGRIVGNDRIFKSEKQILCSCEEKRYEFQVQIQEFQHLDGLINFPLQPKLS
jgi:hypothetical protein